MPFSLDPLLIFCLPKAVSCGGRANSSLWRWGPSGKPHRGSQGQRCSWGLGAGLSIRWQKPAATFSLSFQSQAVVSSLGSLGLPHQDPWVPLKHFTSPSKSVSPHPPAPSWLPTVIMPAAEANTLQRECKLCWSQSWDLPANDFPSYLEPNPCI